MALRHKPGIKVDFIIEGVDRETVETIDTFSDDIYELYQSPVEIKECSKVSVRFESSLPGAVLEIKNLFGYGEDFIKIYPCETKKLFEGKNKYSMLIPGDHEIRVAAGNIKYYSTFTIIPRHINDMQLQNLRDYVNKQIGGLSYNLRTVETLKGRTRDLTLPDYINIYKAYEREFPAIRHGMEEILKSPIYTLDKVYVRGQNVRKEDKKTLRFSEKRNGGEGLQIKRCESIDSRENAVIKKIISNMYNELRSIESNLAQCIEQLGIELSIRKRDYHEKEHIMGINHNTDFRTWENERKSKSLNQTLMDVNESRKKIKELEEFIEETGRMLTVISKYLNTGFLREITEFHNVVQTASIFKNPLYSKLYRCYQKIKGTGNKTTFNYKPSELLYEYFVLLNTLNIISDLGFELQDSDFKRLLSARFIDRIPEGCSALFKKEALTIEVWYEKELLSIPYEAYEMDGGFYTHTNNRLPDIRIDVYDGGRLIKSMMIEIKYRRYLYLWSDYENTETMVQIKNYKTTVQYISKRISRPIMPVERVVVVYPGQHDIEPVVEKDWGDYVFLQMRPGSNIDRVYGYEEFKRIILELLKSC